MVGKRLYFGDEIFRIVEVSNSGHAAKVTDLGGNPPPVNWTSHGQIKTVIVCHAGGFGTCKTNGTDVLRISGDGFIPLTNADYFIKIAGVTYRVVYFSDPDLIAIDTNLGVNSGPLEYEWWASVNDISAAIRVHRVSGAGFEENVTLSAHARGEFRLQALGSGGTFPHRQYPLNIGSGYEPDGNERDQITLDGNTGDSIFGGGFDKYTLRVTYQNEYGGSALRISSGAPWDPVFLSAEGNGESIDIVLQPKGYGYVQLGQVIDGHSTYGAPVSLFVKDGRGRVVRLLAYLV